MVGRRSFWEECWREHLILLTLISLIGLTMIFCDNCGTSLTAPCPICPDQQDTYASDSTTVVAEVPCGEKAVFSGENAYPAIQPFVLGTETGSVNFRFDALDVPDRFVVTHDGEIVLDTGYRGRASYNVLDSKDRKEFQQSLRSRKDPVSGKTYPFQSSNHQVDGYPKVISPGDGTLTFTKASRFPAEVEVMVFGPDGGTSWGCIVDCVNE